MAEQLKHSRSELQQHQNLLKQVQKELELTKNELSHCKVTEDRLSGEVTAYKELLKHRDHDKENLQADAVKLERELRAAQEALVRKETQVGEQAKKMENKLGEVLNELKHVKTRNQELERGKSQMEVVRETLERRVTALAEDLERMQLKMDSAQSKERELVSQRNEAEGKVREKEAQVEGTIAQLKQELVQRSQQVCVCVCVLLYVGAYIYICHTHKHMYAHLTQSLLNPRSKTLMLYCVTIKQKPPQGDSSWRGPWLRGRPT